MYKRQEDLLLLNPIPGSGQYPMLRFGFGFHLTPVQVPDEASFSVNPGVGTVEWALTTGRLKFNAADLAAYAGKPVYYDGTLFAWKTALPSAAGGTVTGPAALASVPVAGGDIIFRTSAGYQFPQVRRVTSFDAGTAGEVQVRSDGAVLYSAADQATFGATPVTVTTCDLTIEHGVAVRFFRSPVNLDGQNPAVKDVTAVYTTEQAVWASPVIQVPFVFLPATPIEDLGYPLSVYVEQGTGSFTGPLLDLNVAIPPVGLGYLIDYEARRLYYAQRKANQLIPFPQAGAALPIGDVAVQEEHLVVSVESAPGTGIYTPLIFGVSALFDKGSGLVTLMSPHGGLITEGSGGFVGQIFTDTTKDFVALGILPGCQLVIPSGSAAGVYTITGVAPTQLATDVAAPVAVSRVSYEVRTQGETLADRYFAETTPLDPNTKVERIRQLGAVQSQQQIYLSPIDGQFNSPTQLTDTSVDFVALGVLPGDVVRLMSGIDSLSCRTILIVEPTQLTVDRAFTTFPSAAYWIERRLRIPRTLISRSRVRIGQTFVPLITKPTNAAFTLSVLLPAGQVEVSEETGDLNFSVFDMGGPQAYWGLTLRTPGDFRVSKDLGFIELSERLLTNDEIYVTYKPVTSAGVQPVITEHVGFLIRKELTQPWPRVAVTNTVAFNPAGRTVASTPAPDVYRGGRPQDDSQVQVNTATSTIVFQPNQGFMSDALPSGASLEPDERVLVDYFVYQAVGGEKSFNVLQPPIYAAQVLIGAGASTFVLVGDQTALFPPGYLLRIEKQQVYLIGTSVYSPATDLTTITLAYGTSFQDDFTNPKLYVSSGAVPLTPLFPQSSYFVTEMAPFGVIPRGMNTFSLPGDASLSYPTGTVALFSDNATYFDLYLVSGATFKDGKTTIVLQQNVRQQYGDGAVLKRSVRPIVEDGVTQTTTKDTPLLQQGVRAYRRVEGQVGVLMASPDDYSLDASGVFRYAQPLQPNEAILLCYSSYRMVAAGTRLQTSYTSLVTPTDGNGLLGQILKADYSLLSPDTFYYRVETLTNFSAEVLQALEASAKSSSPSGGPTTSNASSPTLFQQGRESLFFTEGHTANVDYVSRQFLTFFNDKTHHLEDVLQDADGRVVGDVNGRFRFDGVIGNPVRTAYSQVTNEIDDVFKISEFPVEVTSVFPLVITYLGTYQALYQASAVSRFYPTSKAHLTAITTNGTPTAESGEKIGDFGQKSLTSLPSVAYRRLPRAMVLADAPTGGLFLTVDNASGTPTFFRPPFDVGMAVVIKAPDGTDIVSDAGPLTVAAVLTAPDRLQVGPLPVQVPAGSTVFLCTTGATPDTVYAKTYRIGFDVAVEANEGQIIFIKPYPPFDGTVPLVPAPLQVQPPGPGEVLEMDGVGILQTAMAPFRFPALDGLTASDCGDQSIPILSPTQEQEPVGNAQEAAAIAAALLATTAPVTRPGVTLDVTGTIITNPGVWPAPVPQLHDLVQFTTGANTLTGFRRISAVGATTVTVDTPFPSPGVGGSVVITATANVATGTATFPGPTTLQDLLLSPAVAPGQTIIITSGANTGVRRQVVFVLSATQLQLDAAVPFLGGGTYRVSNHLRTYSHWTPVQTAIDEQIAVTTLNDHLVNPLVVDSVVVAIDRFFVGVAGMVGPQALADLTTIRGEADVWSGVCTSWSALVWAQTSVTVTPADPDIYANSLLVADFTARQADLAARLATLTSLSTGTVAAVEAIVKTRDKLYDKRYAWIDARINVQSGSLFVIQRAVQSRIDATVKLYNDLLKILSVQAT